MKLQARFLLLLLLVFLAVGGLLLVQRNFDLQRSESVLSTEITQRKSLFTANMQSEGKTFQIFSEDYSFWDDMVDFVQNEDLEFAKINIDSGLETFEADSVWVYRADNSLLYNTSSNPDLPFSTLKLPDNFFEKITEDKFEHFYMSTPDGIIEIRAATIVPSDDPNHDSAPSGFWVIGRLLDKVYVSGLAASSQSTVKFLPPNAGEEDKIGGSSVSFSVPLKDLDGKTIKLLNSSSEISLISQLDVIYRRELLLLAVVSAIILTLISLSVWRFVLKPVRLITSSISRQDSALLAPVITSSSQFGDLARTIQEFFKQKLVIQEDQFKKAELERLNKEKAAFLAVAAHELKSPIAIIKLLAEDLPRSLPSNLSSPGVNSQLGMITHQSAKMATLINDLRLASQGEEEMTLNKTIFDFDEFMIKEITELGYITEHKLEFSGSTGKKVSADPDRLSQVVSNLIRNASKYSPDSDKIIIRSVVNENRVVVEVQDFGIGIAPEDKEHIFERFYRAPNVAETFEGLGLGLSISKGILTRMGGTIWFQSEIGKGTSFYFSLPFVDFIG